MGARGAYLAFKEPKAVKQRLPVGCDFALKQNTWDCLETF